MKRAISLVLSLLLTTFAQAEEVKYLFKAPENQREAAIKQEMEVLFPVDNVIKMLNDVFVMPRGLTIAIGGESGPAYDMEANEITIPYGFVEEVRGVFTQNKYQDTGVSVQEASMDVMLYVLLHEIAHAMIRMYDFPTLAGREENAADELTTVLLLEFFDDGTEVVISAADLVDMRSRTKQETPAEDFWERHDFLNEPRYYRSICNVYGSNPKEYPELLEGTGITQKGAQVCIDEYKKLVNDWTFLLGPYIKPAPEQPASAESTASSEEGTPQGHLHSTP